MNFVYNFLFVDGFVNIQDVAGEGWTLFLTGVKEGGGWLYVRIN